MTRNQNLLLHCFRTKIITLPNHGSSQALFLKRSFFLFLNRCMTFFSDVLGPSLNLYKFKRDCTYDWWVPLFFFCGQGPSVPKSVPYTYGSLPLDSSEESVDSVISGVHRFSVCLRNTGSGPESRQRFISPVTTT